MYIIRATELKRPVFDSFGGSALLKGNSAVLWKCSTASVATNSQWVQVWNRWLESFSKYKVFRVTLKAKWERQGALMVEAFSIHSNFKLLGSTNKPAPWERRALSGRCDAISFSCDVALIPFVISAQNVDLQCWWQVNVQVSDGSQTAYAGCSVHPSMDATGTKHSIVWDWQSPVNRWVGTTTGCNFQ